MKRLTLMLAAIAGIAAISCESSQASLAARREYVSWIAFCAARGYQANSRTYTVTNEYLHTWCGTYDEQQALINAGIQPY